jgi:hypothetical protein
MAFYAFMVFKEVQKTWSCYEIFPIEVVYRLAKDLVDTIFEFNDYPCKEKKCIDAWKCLKEEKLEDSNFHCNCHDILFKYEGFPCDRCRKHICEYCVYHVDDNIVNNDFDSDESYETFHYCFDCIYKIKCIEV